MKVKRKISFLIIMAMLLSLAACSEKNEKIKVYDSDKNTTEEVTVEDNSEVAEVTEATEEKDDVDKASVEDTTEATEEADATTESEEDINARTVAYNEAIRAFIEEGRIPPYEEEYFEEPSEINQYAVCDVNSDGKDELLIRVNEGAMASLCIYVFLYENDELRQIGTFFSDDTTTFYDNKVATAPLSHGAASWGEYFWGVNICVYNEELGEYEYKYVTDAWDSSVEGVWHGDEEVFPTEYDKDGNGMLYWYIEYINDEYVESEPMDDEEYFAWFDEITGGAHSIIVPWENAVR